MADIITIYHGSNVVVEKPQIIVSGFYKDFGLRETYSFQKMKSQQTTSISSAI